MTVTAYARRWPAAFFVLFAAAGAGLELLGTLTDTRTVTAAGLAVHGLTLLAAAHIRGPRRKRPLFAVSRDGIEGDFGRVPWAAIERATVERRWWRGLAVPWPHRCVVLGLRKGAQIERTYEDWSTTAFGDKPRLRRDEIVLPLWTRRQRAMELIRESRNRPFEGWVV